MKILINRDNHQMGPYSLVEVEQMVDAGTLHLDDLAKYEDRSGWVRLRKLPGFFYRPAYAPAKFEIRTLSIFVTRNGQKLGPCSLAHVQNMLNTGAVQLTDLARYENQSAWVPLDQLPGFVARPTPAKPRVPRPVLVWIICIPNFLACALVLSGLIIFQEQAAFNDTQKMISDSFTWVDDCLTPISYIVQLLFAVQLFRLRRLALPFYVASLALDILFEIYSVYTGNAYTLIKENLILIFVVWGIRIAILAYIWNLCKKGILR